MIDDQIREMITKANIIGITSHIRPDGDAIGAVLGLGLSLIKHGKQVEMVLVNGVSKTFRQLAGAVLVKKTFEKECDLYMALDCSDLERTGGVLDGRHLDIVVDHHITNKQFASVNLVEPDSVATCAILAEHMPKWGLEIDEQSASALLSGIISDSLGFRTSNTTSSSLRVAADLMDQGANITRLYNRALVSRPYETVNYWGHGLVNLQRENGLVWTTLTLQDRRMANYLEDDDADLTNILSSIEGLDIAVLFVEQKNERVKVSWRSRPGLDVASIADSLGGGGHPAAAGVDLSGNLETIKELILEKTRNYLKNNGVETPLDKKTE